MKPFTNECGSRCDFGYYDRVLKEIVLERPCLKRTDLELIYTWLEEDAPLRRFSIGLGPAEVFSNESNSNAVYAMAKGVFKNTVSKIKQSDTEMLHNYFIRLRNKKTLRNLCLKSFMFYDDEELFDDLLETIKSFDHLVFLSLAGCFFSEEQLIMLAEVISDTTLSNLVWPEQHMSIPTLKRVSMSLARNQTLVAISDSPAELKAIAERNRKELLSLGMRNRMLNDDEIAKIKENKDSIRLAITYERDLIGEMEKTFEGVFMKPEDCRYMEFDPLLGLFKIRKKRK